MWSNKYWAEQDNPFLQAVLLLIQPRMLSVFAAKAHSWPMSTLFLPASPGPVNTAVSEPWVHQDLNFPAQSPLGSPPPLPAQDPISAQFGAVSPCSQMPAVLAASPVSAPVSFCSWLEPLTVPWPWFITCWVRGCQWTLLLALQDCAPWVRAQPALGHPQLQLPGLGLLLGHAASWKDASLPGSPSLYCCQSFFLPRCRTLHLSSLNFIRLLLAHSSNLARSLWMAALPFSFIIYVCKIYTYIHKCITALHFRVSKWFKYLSPFMPIYASTRTTVLMKFCTISVYYVWLVENNPSNSQVNKPLPPPPQFLVLQMTTKNYYTISLAQAFKKQNK